jgi:hypothetical protein
MRLLAAAHVRNEADIVEAFVRHNLALLDGIAIVDHMSVDETPDILRELKAEGLPIFIAQDASPAFDQQLMQNRLVRHLFATTEAAWVFPLDADEFLRAPSRGAVEETLTSLGDVAHVAMEWATYVPEFDASATALARIRNARRLRDDGHGLRKVAVSRTFGADPDLYLVRGQHRVESRAAGAARRPPQLLPPRALSIAHVPIRSAHQFTAKVALGWLSNLRVPAREPNESLHWKEAFEYLRSGRPMTPRQLEAFAFNYGVPMERWLPTDAHALVEDPFLREFPLRYYKGETPAPLPLVLRQVEGLLRANGASS